MTLSLILLICRSYDELGWDSKLPRRFKAPAITLERMSDPVAERRSSRRYNSQPQLWQVSQREQTATESAKADDHFFYFPAAAGSLSLHFFF